MNWSSLVRITKQKQWRQQRRGLQFYFTLVVWLNAVVYTHAHATSRSLVHCPIESFATFILWICVCVLILSISLLSAIPEFCFWMDYLFFVAFSGNIFRYGRDLWLLLFCHLIFVVVVEKWAHKVIKIDSHIHKNSI